LLNSTAGGIEAMHLSPARWTTALAAAALIALPGAALAQSNPTQNPPAQNPPTQTQQPPTQPPSTPPPPAQQAPTQPTPQSTSPSSAASGQVDAAAAKQHLTEARDALSQMTSMPEAAKLQGDARTKVSELISNFNALITTQADWRASDAKVNDSLVALLGSDIDQAPNGAGAGDATAGATGTTGTTGTAGTATTGTTGAAGSTGSAASSGTPVQLDPALRGKLVEFRTHLKEFEKAAGGASEPAPSTAPSAAPDSTSSPATPATAVSGATGTSGSGKPSPATEQTKPSTDAPTPTATAPATTGATDQDAKDQNSNAAAKSELAAIDAILAKSKTGALTQTETSQLKQHIEALRALIK
jgi:hypothetical protein